MKTTNNHASETSESDVVLRELWRAKDTLSAARGHNIDLLFAEARERQKQSGQRIVNLQGQRKKPAEQKLHAL